MPSIADYSNPNPGFLGVTEGTWAKLGSGAGDLFQGAADIFQGFQTKAADVAQAHIYGEEANYLGLGQQQQADLDFLKLMAEQRKAGQAIGGEEAAAAASGRLPGGSVLSLIRESTMQGAVQQGIAAQQAAINYQQYQGQIEAANMEAEAASKAGQSAELGGIMGAIGGIAKAGFLFL